MKTNNLEKQVHYYSLFVFYHQLLTTKQQQYFKNYFNDNLSLQEIASLQKVSRNAIYDSLQKVLLLLNQYENKLQLYQKYQARAVIYEQYQATHDFIKQLQAIDKI